MTGVEALLPWIQTFLKDDLGSVPLPPPIETKRLAIVDQLDRLACSSAAQACNSTTPCTNSAVQPSPQRRTFSSVARLFSSSSRKRFSLPASFSLAPPLIEVPAAARNSSGSVEPPLPPKGTHKTRVNNGSASQDYEEPRSIMVQSSDSVHHPRHHPLIRLSLSPQLEILESHRTESLQSSTGPGNDSSSVRGDTRDDIDLTLPKRCLTTQARRFSAFMDPPWTLAGSLHQRYKPNKWTRLNLCLLIGGSRLIGYRSGHALTPNLVLFLCGCTGIYAGRDSGMDHVIKVAHSTRGMAVLAADTEEQALVWIRQINLYAQGITPSDVVSFLEQPSRISPVGTGVTVVQSPAGTEQRMDGGSNSSSVAAAIGAVSAELQEDSGFSAPLSSGSEGNSADGVVSNANNQQHSFLTTSGVASNPQCPVPAVELSPHSSCISPSAVKSIDLDQIRLRHKEKTVDGVPKSRPVSLFSSSSRTTLPASFRPSGLLRRDPVGGVGGGLLSSMRRKVESFHSKRRARKSLPQSFISPSDSSSLSKANSSADLVSQSTLVSSSGHTVLSPVPSPVVTAYPLHRRTGSDGQWTASDGHAEPTIVVPPPAACVLNSPTRVGPGFDWAQLESACSLFFSSLTSNGTSGLRRPHSFALSGSVVADYGHGQSGVGSLMNMSSPRLGPLLDLRPQPVDTQRNSMQSDVEYRNDIIIAGEACISIPGKVPWTNRWCCLHSRSLDIYPLASQPCSNSSNLLLTDELSPSRATNTWPLFSLSLEPGQVELGLAGDKRHKAAVRLAMPKQSATALLFDVPDKLHMGAWIRGFIQALGIIPPADTTEVKPDATYSGAPKSSPSVSVPSSSCLEYDIPDQLDSPRKLYRFVQTSSEAKVQHSCQSRQLVLDNPDHFKLETLSDSESRNIYDEVCPPSAQDSTANGCGSANSSQFKRRWSSPSLPLNIPPGPRMCWYGMNGAEKDCSSRPYTACTTSKARETSSVRSWHIPPPSRLLLAQPLPPLPSVGPSAAESIAGTMTSSRTSSSQTPEERRNHLCSGSSHNSEPELNLLISPTNPTRTRPSESRQQDYHCHHRCRGSHQDDRLCSSCHRHSSHLSSLNMYSNPSQLGHKRHASLGSLDDDKQQRRCTVDSGPIYQSLRSVASHCQNPSVLGWIVDNAQSNSIDPPSRAKPNRSVRSGCTIKASGSQDDDVSEITDTLEISFPSEISPLGSSETHVHSAAPQLPWFDLPAQWWLSHHQQHTRAEHSVIAAARRSVSCVTGTKPCPVLTDTRAASTLPARHECETAMLHPMLFEHRSGRLSQTSSRTATSSSGVALTVGSSSCSGSSCTTRPGSHMALSRPPPPVPEEPFGWPDSEAQEVYVYPSVQAAGPAPQKPALEIPSSTNCRNLTRIDAHVQCDSISCHSSRNCSPSESLEFTPAHSSPNNASLILVATQLEEVHEEAKKLRSRRQTLSSRLTNTLISHRRHTTDCLLPINQSEMAMDHHLERSTLASPTTPVLPDNSVIPTSTQTLSLLQPVESNVTINSSSLGSETGTGIPVPTQYMEQEERQTMEGSRGLDDALVEGEAVESLCARLAAVELLIQQAESTEARLREEFDHCFRRTTDNRLNLPMSSNNRLSSSIPVSPPADRIRLENASVDASATTTILSPRRRRRGRHCRLLSVAQPNPDQSQPKQSDVGEPVCFSNCQVSQSRPRGGPVSNNGPNKHAATGGRGGGGGRFRRRNAGGQRRERRQPPSNGSWNKTSNPNSCSVAVSPAS